MNVLLSIIPGISLDTPSPAPTLFHILHLGPGPLQGPLEFAKEQYGTGGTWRDLANRTCRQNLGVRVDEGSILHLQTVTLPPRWILRGQLLFSPFHIAAPCPHLLSSSPGL